MDRDGLLRDVEQIVHDKFQLELDTLESRWSKNPLFDLFKSNQNDESGFYVDLVRQVSSDFKKYFFDEWARTLRQQRPFMNSMRTQAMNSQLQEREQMLLTRIEELHIQMEILMRRVTALESKQVVNHFPLDPPDTLTMSTNEETQEDVDSESESNDHASVQKILESNTHKGLEAKLKFSIPKCNLAIHMLTADDIDD